VRAIFSNPDGTLIPGLFAPLHLDTSKAHKALVVQDAAVRTEDGKHFVFVVNEKKCVELRLIKLGQRHGDLREVKSGLNADDLVVVGGVKWLEGDNVTPKVVAMPGVSKRTDRPTPDEK
jgi:multidrug efflux system membrane fusion protein